MTSIPSWCNRLLSVGRAAGQMHPPAGQGWPDARLTARGGLGQPRNTGALNRILEGRISGNSRRSGRIRPIQSDFPEIAGCSVCPAGQRLSGRCRTPGPLETGYSVSSGQLGYCRGSAAGCPMVQDLLVVDPFLCGGDQAGATRLSWSRSSIVSSRDMEKRLSFQTTMKSIGLSSRVASEIILVN